MNDFNPLIFIADHAGMNLADAIKEAYEQGKKDAQPDFDMTEKIDKAHDDGYKQGYLQGKADYERKKGMWIYNGDYYMCDKCGTTYSWWADSQTSNYCPNCGADMRGDEV